MSLEIYARVEHLLGLEEPTETLHAIVADVLEELGAETVLDLGCGRGALMRRLNASGCRCFGIDRSETMAAAARDAGLEAECREICEVEGTFDAVAAVFDVLNFVEPDALEDFFACVARVLRPGGHFIADVNTLHGFANVAEGTMSVEEPGRFLSIDAVFEADRLQTRFTLFEEQDDGCYLREEGAVTQYFHPMKVLRSNGSLALVEQFAVSLYDDEDKRMLIFKKHSDA